METFLTIYVLGMFVSGAVYLAFRPDLNVLEVFVNVALWPVVAALAVRHFIRMNFGF